MRIIMFLCFIFSLPLLGVIVHDVYTYYETYQEYPDAPFNFSELGAVWLDYSEDTHDQAVRALGPETWNETVKPLLRQPAILYAAAVAGVVYIISFIIWLFAIWPANRTYKVKKGKSDFASVSHSKKTFQYKRK